MHMMGVSPRKPVQLDGKFMNACGIMGHKLFSCDCLWLSTHDAFLYQVYVSQRYKGPDEAINTDVCFNLITIYTRRILGNPSFASDFNGA